MLTTIVVFVVGFLIGATLTYVIKTRQDRESRDLADELLRDSETRRQQDIDRVIEQVKSSFGNLSSEALKTANDEFIKVRKEFLDADRQVQAKELDSKKGLIDEQLKSMSTELERVRQLMVGLDKDRAAKYGELDASLKAHQSQVQVLIQTASSLREALSSTKARGQWGERMAEDVLRLAGFIENVNYFKQKTMNEGRSRPDFTFLLPQGLILNMDVKFPFENYMRFIDAGNDTEQSRYRGDFLRDVKQHIKAVNNREYINPAENTVDYVLLFIPNEQVYAFVNESDRALLDEALRNKVIVCSPLTLYAILAVIRQASDSFAFEQASEQILRAIASFDKQWKMFVDKMDTLGKKIDESQKAFLDLTTTRRRQLDRTIDKIQDLRTQKGIELLEEPPDPDNNRD